MDMVLVSKFLQIVLQTFIAITAPLIIAVVIKYINTYSAKMWTELTSEQKYIISTVITMAVNAAEQSGLSNELLKTGIAKKNYALTRAEIILKSYNLDLDIHILDTMIEAEVWKQFNANKTD